MKIPPFCIIVLALVPVIVAGGPVMAEDAVDEYRLLEAIGYQDAAAPGETGGVTLGGDATLDDYRLYAALHSPKLEAAFLRWKASLDDVVRAHSLGDPRLTYGYFIRAVETRVGPQRQRLDLTQTFPWFGTLDLRSAVSLEASRARWQMFQEQRLALAAEVEDAWYDLYYLDRSVTILAQNMTLLASLEQVVRTRYTVGMAGQGALIRAQVELARIEERLVSLRAYRRPLEARLNAALNRPADAPVFIGDSAPAVPELPPDDELAAAALARSPGLAALEHDQAREALTAELGRKRFRPDIGVGASWTITGDARMPGVGDSGKDPLMAMVTLNLPLFRGAYEAGVRQAKLRELAARREHDDRATVLDADLTTALFRFNDAARTIALYRDTLLPKAHQSYEVTRRGFEGGTAEFTDLIDTQRTLLELQLAYERSVVGRLKAFSTIAHLTGGAVGDGPEPMTP